MLCSLPWLLALQGFYTVDGTHRLFTMPYEPLQAGGGGTSGGGGEGEDEGQGVKGESGGAGGSGGGGGGGCGGGGGGAHSTMWQLSIAIPDEAAAVALCGSGGAVLLAEARRRCAAWHSPVPQMLAATLAASVRGSPCNPTHPACNPARCSLQPHAYRYGAALHSLLATCYSLPATRYLLLATCYSLLLAPLTATT